MRNKYPGTCYRCGGFVEVGAGHFEKIMGTKNKWRVQHADCAIKHRKVQRQCSVCDSIFKSESDVSVCDRCSDTLDQEQKEHDQNMEHR